MTRRKSTTKPAADETQNAPPPSVGGSFLREADGTLTPANPPRPAPADPEKD